MKGADLVKETCINLPEKPGIYKMISEEGDILYIGKAKNLRKRVIYYSRTAELPSRLARMVFLIRKIEYVVTSTEAEAFLLEATQIKQHMPRFNILLKDDKSYPYIKLKMDHDYPQIMKFRGKKTPQDKFFGPFASSQDVDRTINVIKKIFKIRGCSDNYFAARQRPCLQYQIKRCSGPCVGRISKEDYAESLGNTMKFLNGQSAALQEELSKKMEFFSESLQFEKAAEIRDGLKALSYVQINASSADGAQDTDVIAVLEDKSIYCVQIFFYRAGQNFGSNIYFPRHAEGASPEEVLSGFVGQFYQKKPPAKIILSNIPMESKEVIEEALYKLHKVKCKFVCPGSSAKDANAKKLVDHAMLNVSEALKREILLKTKNNENLERVAELFGLPEIPTRIEVYDNSHIMGKFAIGAMVVAGVDGFMKSEYRKVNVEAIYQGNHWASAGLMDGRQEWGEERDEVVDQAVDQGVDQVIDPRAYITGGDDYGMMRQVLERRIKRFEKEPNKIPSLIIIDGGKGHLSTALKVFDEHNIDIPIVCISKGEKRNAGGESFHMRGRKSFTLSNDLPEMKYLQILRDEVHNYAITSHRKKRAKAISSSLVDEIPGVGPARKKALLNYFGSFDAIKSASITDLQKAPGISAKLASSIKEYFNQ